MKKLYISLFVIFTLFFGISFTATINIDGGNHSDGNGIFSGIGTIADGGSIDYDWTVTTTGLDGNDLGQLNDAGSCLTMNYAERNGQLNGGSVEWNFTFPSSLSGLYIVDSTSMSDYLNWTISRGGGGSGILNNDETGYGMFPVSGAARLVDGPFASATTFRFDTNGTPDEVLGGVSTSRIDLPNAVTSVTVRADIHNIAQNKNIVNEGMQLCFGDVEIPAPTVDVVVTAIASGSALGYTGFDIAINCNNFTQGLPSNGNENINLAPGASKTYKHPINKGLSCTATEDFSTEQLSKFDVTYEVVDENGDVTIRTNNAFISQSIANLEKDQTYTLRVISTPKPINTFTIEARTPNGDGGLGPFDVQLICGGGVNETFSLAGGTSTTYTLGEVNRSCYLRPVLTNAQKSFFKTRRGDTQGSDNGIMYHRTNGSFSIKDQTIYVEFTYVPTEVVEINVAKVLKDGNDGGKGPFNINITCGNGDSYDFEMNHGDVETFQYEKDTGMNCLINEELTTTQEGFFKVEKGDTFGPSNGRILGNSTSISESSGTLAGGVTYTQGTMEIFNEYVPDQVVRFDVAKVLKDGNDGGKGPFNINVTCRNGDEYNFEMNHGDVERFYYPKDERMYCAVTETLTASQEGFFKVKKGDTFGGDQGIMLGNSTTASETTRTLAGGVTYTQGTFEVFNEYVPEGTIRLNINKSCPNGDGGRLNEEGNASFDVDITCRNGDAYTFDLACGETTSFFYEKDAPISCIVSEDLTGGQIDFFSNRYGDTYGPNNGRVFASNSTITDGETFTIENTYVSEGGAVALNSTIHAYPECGDGNTYARFTSSYAGNIFVGEHQVLVDNWFVLSNGSVPVIYTDSGNDGLIFEQTSNGTITVSLVGIEGETTGESNLQLYNADFITLNEQNLGGGDEYVQFFDLLLQGSSGTKSARFNLINDGSEDSFSGTYTSAQNRCELPISSREVGTELMIDGGAGSSISTAEESISNDSKEDEIYEITDLEDPYTCGAGIIGNIVSSDISNSSVKIELIQNGKTMYSFDPDLASDGTYGFGIEYDDTNSSFYVVDGEYTVKVSAIFPDSSEKYLTYEAFITDSCGTDLLDSPEIDAQEADELLETGIAKLLSAEEMRSIKEKIKIRNEKRDHSGESNPNYEQGFKLPSQLAATGGKNTLVYILLALFGLIGLGLLTLGSILKK